MANTPGFRNRSVNADRYAMVPRSDVPRSSFKTTSSVKTTFNAGGLVPIYVDEVLPGDSHSVRMTAFCRLGTVLYPIMDNLHLETFFFFVPARLVWDNWVKFMGEQDAPGDTTSYLVPLVFSPEGGWAIGSIADYFGLPTVGQVAPLTQVSANALPLRAYTLIYNEWFRDQNLGGSVVFSTGDGPDGATLWNQIPTPRMKRPDYFTTALPWPAKPTSLDASQGFPYMGEGPYQGTPGSYRQVGVPVTGLGGLSLTAGAASPPVYETGSLVPYTYASSKQLNESTAAVNTVYARTDADGLLDIRVTINAIRQAFAVQRLQERDARGGTRYTELIRAHFGVVSPDARLQRPEYLGGGSSIVQVTPVAQQSATGETGSTTPLGHLSATATGLAQGHGFSQSFTEHGYIIGLASVRADLNYYHGVHRMWHRRNKYDFYWPAFAHLGEQPILNREIYMDGSAADTVVFGFQERWAEYRSKPGMITGRFRGNAPTGTLDAWHLAQRFSAHPNLNTAFIQDPTQAILDRVLAAGSAASGANSQILFDGFYDIRRVRALPAFSVPGLIDHF